VPYALYANTSGNGAGPAGADGIDGVDGLAGTNGSDGATGPQGPTGIDGPAGADGIGIAQTLLISGDTLFISSGNYILIPGLSLINSLIAEGCTDPTAFNYDASANTDDGSCISVVLGCTDATACNYNSVATENDASCTYAEADLDCDGNPIALNYAIGDLVEGGIVFYIDETGEHGLVAALEDLTEGSNMGVWGTPEGFEWGCYGTSVATANQNYAIGTGLENTQAIVSQNCQTENGGITAAQAALNYENEGYTDWFLPSFNELVQMYNTIEYGGLEGNIGGFVTAESDFPYYWSSSEANSNYAWYVNFYDGYTDDGHGKSASRRVRCVRAFGNEDEVVGCMDNTACNYDSSATDAGNCDYAAANYDCEGTCLNDIDSDGICDEDEVVGCMDNTACNYTPEAEFSDASCTYAEADLDCDGNPIALNYAIGDLVEGGIVFYLDGNGGGLIAAPTDQSTGAEWGCYGANISGADGTAIGTGAQNTIDIVNANCSPYTPGNSIAANICANLTLGGYSDWFLPSKDELNLMYQNIGQGNVLGLGNVGGFADNWYWSSTEYDNNLAWKQGFDYGGQDIDVKNDTDDVRPVRAF
jgi:hypothetical protein